MEGREAVVEDGVEEVEAGENSVVRDITTSSFSLHVDLIPVSPCVFFLRLMKSPRSFAISSDPALWQYVKRVA